MSEAEDLAARVAALEGEVHGWTRSGPHPKELAEAGWEFLRQHPVLLDTSTRERHDRAIETIFQAMMLACRSRREKLPPLYLENNPVPDDYDLETGWIIDNDEDEDDFEAWLDEDED